MSETLIFTLSTGETVSLDVEDGGKELERFAAGQEPYNHDWIRLGEQVVRRDAIIKAHSVPTSTGFS
ncbi:MAG: hypothetical protein C5B48_14260 [Candidatus Rokuibacteriota bacterium]|nr:MAG: hypothetical protein C5B48_14260 [Candidatus Rokubacteria bacterium]